MNYVEELVLDAPDLSSIKEMFKGYNRAVMQEMYVFPHPCKPSPKISSGIITKNKIKIRKNMKYVMTVLAQAFGDSLPYFHGGIGSKNKTYIKKELMKYECVFEYDEDIYVDIGIIYKNYKPGCSVAIQSISYMAIPIILGIPGIPEIIPRRTPPEIIPRRTPPEIIPRRTPPEIIPRRTPPEIIVSKEKLHDNEIIEPYEIIATNEISDCKELDVSLLNSIYLSPDNKEGLINAINKYDVIILVPGEHYYEDIIINRAISITGQSANVKLFAKNIIINVTSGNVIFSNCSITAQIVDSSSCVHTLDFDLCYIYDSKILQNSPSKTRIRNCYIENNEQYSGIIINKGAFEIFRSIIISNNKNLCITICSQSAVLINTIIENNADDALSLIYFSENVDIHIIKSCAFKFNKYLQDSARTAIISKCDIYIENSNFYLSGGQYVANMNNYTLNFKNNFVKKD
jgi:hypothetical protein